MKNENVNIDATSLNEDFYEFAKLQVEKGQSSVRIDKYLMDRLENSTRSRIQNACKSGRTLVNGNPVKQNYKVRPGDVIQYYLEKAPYSKDYIEPQNIPLDIIFEDEHILIINKQAGLVVHPGVGNPNGTLVNGLVYYLQSSEIPVMEGNQSDRPGLVHRIDKDTTGLMVIAKTEEAIIGLSKQFYNHSIERTYKALVWGDVEERTGTIESNIARHPSKRTQMFVYDPEEEVGKHAVTHYEVVENLYYVTLVKCKLETGRTHQIRVHMKYIGHTLFNDEKYGGDQVLKGTVFTNYRRFVENTFEVLPRQALHAETLGFIHPITEERMHFECPLPEDFQNALDRWRGYTSSRKELKDR